MNIENLMNSLNRQKDLPNANELQNMIEFLDRVFLEFTQTPSWNDIGEEGRMNDSCDYKMLKDFLHRRKEARLVEDTLNAKSLN